MFENKKPIWIGIISLIAIITFVFVNPFAWNDATERTVVTTMSGKQFVQFEPGPFYQGFFAKSTVYPNQISVSYQADEADYDVNDNTIEIGTIKVLFNDPAKADAYGITQYILPSDEAKMLEMHNAHKSIEGLVKRRLSPYTQECLGSCAQLMNTEMHYSGGKAQMSQDYLDQLRNGVYLLNVSEVNVYDSIEKSYRKVYRVEKQLDKDKQVKRKSSSIKEYGIVVSDAQITNVDYESAVDSLIAKKLASATAASVSRQALMTAQQQALTAEATGKKTLVETEYKQKVQQTLEVVKAETKVKLQEQYKLEQKAAAEAAIFAAQVVKTDADAEAYKASRLVSAGLSPWDKADFEMKTKIGVATALSKITLPAYYAPGGGASTNNILDALLSSKLLDK